MSMHVVQLGPYPPPEGGVSRNMLAIRDEVERQGNKCSIVVTSKSSHRDGAANVIHPGSAANLLRTLSRMEFDILHLHVGGHLNRRVMGLALAAAMFGAGKSVLTIHSGEFPLSDAAKAAKPKSVNGSIFRRFSRIIAVSDAIANVMRRYGVDEERISVVAPYALKEPDASVEVPKNIAEFCSRSSPLLLSVGGLERDYDPIFQIEAFNGVIKEFPDAGLLLVGSGSLRGEVERAVEDSPYSDRIMVAGNVDHSIVLHVIDRGDVLLRTTLFDGDAISVREALFLGTPVVATDTGNRPDGVRLIAIGDRAALLREISNAVSSGKTKRQSSESGESNIAKVIEIYNSLT